MNMHNDNDLAMYQTDKGARKAALKGRIRNLGAAVMQSQEAMPGKRLPFQSLTNDQ